MKTINQHTTSEKNSLTMYTQNAYTVCTGI